jgi:hypothetical protein
MGGEVLVAAARQIIKGPGNSVGDTRTLPSRIVGGPRPTATVKTSLQQESSPNAPPDGVERRGAKRCVPPGQGLLGDQKGSYFVYIQHRMALAGGWMT